MKKIVLSADSYPAIYNVPDVIADNLMEYINQFSDWLGNINNNHGYWVKIPTGSYGLNYTEEAFIKWINDFIIIDDTEKARLIEQKEYLTEIEELYPNYNF